MLLAATYDDCVGYVAVWMFAADIIPTPRGVLQKIAFDFARQHGGYAAALQAITAHKDSFGLAKPFEERGYKYEYLAALFGPHADPNEKAHWPEDYAEEYVSCKIMYEGVQKVQGMLTEIIKQEFEREQQQEAATCLVMMQASTPHKLEDIDAD